jgi:cargo-transport protein YPP1
LQHILKTGTLSSTLGEQKIWTQRLLARYCILLHSRLKLQAQKPQELITSSSPIAFTLELTPFRTWAESWEASSHQPPKVIKIFPDRGDVPQRLVWHAYYDTLSILIRIRPIFPSSAEGGQISWQQNAQYDVGFFSETKSQQCEELKQVQSIYEKHLVNELCFPKANEATPEIESWVDQVIDNWKIVCGPAWRNEDHIGGGKEATSRIVLEVR